MIVGNEDFVIRSCSMGQKSGLDAIHRGGRWAVVEDERDWFTGKPQSHIIFG